jgi:hypothetical protein
VLFVSGFSVYKLTFLNVFLLTLIEYGCNRKASKLQFSFASSPEVEAIVIKRADGNLEQFTWDTFTLPFSRELWLAILVNTAVCSTFITIWQFCVESKDGGKGIHKN